MDQKQERKPYEEPTVVYESKLEVRACTGVCPPTGTPPNLFDLIDGE